jgi:hypothetical protein
MLEKSFYLNCGLLEGPWLRNPGEKIDREATAEIRKED